MWVKNNLNLLIVALIGLILVILAVIYPSNAILGVLVGFILSVGYNELKQWIKRNRLKSQLSEELKANLHSSQQRKSSLKSAIKNLESAEVLPLESVSFCYE